MAIIGTTLFAIKLKLKFVTRCILRREFCNNRFAFTQNKITENLISLCSKNRSMLSNIFLIFLLLLYSIHRSTKSIY